MTKKILLLSILFSLSASAADSNEIVYDTVPYFNFEEDAIMLNQVVVTATRTPKLLKDVPVVTRVIPENDIKRLDADNIGSVLEAEIPGIEFSYSMNQQKSLNMSGFGGNSVLFLVDGERLAGETLNNVDYDRLNMDNVERIEIVKGAASSLYGSNAVGGVVNIISKKSLEPWYVNVHARYGSHSQTRLGGTAGFNQGIVNSVTTVQFTSIDAINLDNDGDYSSVYGNNTKNFKERLIFTFSDKLNLTARAGFFFRERDSSASQKDRYYSFNGGLKGNYKFDERNDLELSYSFDQYDKSDYYTYNKHNIRDYCNTQNIFRILYNHTFREKDVLTLGTDCLNDYLMSYQFADNGDYTQTSSDVFAQYDWNVSQKVNIVGGLRYDYYSKSDYSQLSPKLSLMYKPGRFTLRCSYAAGFRSPTLKEMYMNFYMGNIFMIYGNPDLKAEKSHNFSLSGEYRKGLYNFTLTGFYNIVKDRITTAWDKSLAGQVYTNMSRLNIFSLDANLSARYRCGISWKASYAYTHEHIRKGEPELSSTRPHTATLRIGYDKDWKNYGLSVTLTGRYLSELTADEYTDITSYEETVTQTYPGYTLWNLNLSQRVWKGVKVTASVENLFAYKPSYYYYNSPYTTGATFSVGLSLDIDKLF
ncbi:MAG: TonB-dependent receptor plug domain-containing protein [Muribaculaceae bacterium]